MKIAQSGTIDPADFSAQLAMQSHRGPDGQSTWIASDQSVAIGHNLLALTGTRNTQQPFTNEDGRLIATVNGEFYGHEELRASLRNKGHLFRSDSDSEIALHLYEEYGEECLKFLRGEFAFAIWDIQKQKLFCARDRFGIKPLHYQSNHEGLTIASEAKVILSSKTSAHWDPNSLMRVFTHQYLAPDETLFQGIRQLPPAHTLVHENGRLKISRYWEPCTEFPSSITPEEVLESLQSSVLDRLHPEAAFSLSGGIDSSAVVALASQHLGKKVPAFSVSFDEAAYDELNLINSTHQEIGATINPVKITRHDLLEHLPEAVAMSEGLAINGQLVGKHLLNRAIQSAGHRVVLSGEGADEALLGYAHVVADSDAGPAIPHPLQRGVMLPSEDTKITTPLPTWLHQWPTFLKAKLGFCQQFSGLLNPDFQEQLQQNDMLARTMDTIASLGFAVPHLDSPHQSAWLWSRLALANAILKTLGDGTEMPHGLEGRVPFLDHHFFEKAWNIPTSEKISNGHSKAIFRKATRPLLPRQITEREKHPFLAPPLLGDPSLSENIREHLASPAFQNLSFINRPAVLTWYDQVSCGTASQQKLADPIIHTLLSSLFLQTSYKLTL
ncbi:asparagine synthase (glutamine-hydrolyzing) [Verrucomicrobiaceae bacterium 227]